MNAGRVVKIILVLFLIGLVVAGIGAVDIYRKAFVANVDLKSESERYLFIHTGSDFGSVYENLLNQGILKNKKSFEWTAERKNYPKNIKPGRYLIKNRMSNNELVNMLRSGNQDVVRLTFNNVNTLQDLSEKVAGQLEFSASELLDLLEDSEVVESYGFNTFTIPAMFIPNTYEFYWNTNPEVFLKRMKREYDVFWNKKRQAKAERIGLTPKEVITLASIVNKEVRFDDEKRRVAGLYMNRIQKGIRLQADPTLIFAHNDYSIRRVTNDLKKIDSPYNTYKNDGLPPGPICIPDIASIDAVLNFEKHNYIYMCAKADLSGYHSFAKTLKEHNKNARAYQKELNRRRIYR